MTNSVAFDFDSLMSMPTGEALKLLGALREEGFEVHVVSWRAVTLDGYSAMVSALARTRLLCFTTRIDRSVAEGAIYVSRDALPMGQENLLQSIRAMAHKEEI